MNTRVETLSESTKQATFNWKQHRETSLFAILSGVLILLILQSLNLGAVAIEPRQILAITLSHFNVTTPWGFTPLEQSILESIRAPRVILGVLVGASLAVSGAALQGLFRNPLADPGLVGVSSGAALAAVAVIVLGGTWLKPYSGHFGLYALPFAAFIGGFIITLVVYKFSKIGGRADISTMLLAGIAVSAIAGAITGLLVYAADDKQLRTLTFWSMGSLGGATWDQVKIAALFIIPSLILIPRHSKVLDAILLGESEAFHLGFDLEKTKRNLIILVALCVGAAVSFTGVIGFVGLVTPHLLRLAIGPGHRFLLPASALLGASLLLAADMLARTVVAPAELPIGIITAILGGPFFLWLLTRRHRQ